MKAGILGGTPSSNYRGTVFVIPRQPRNKKEFIRQTRDLVRQYFGESPDEDMIGNIACRPNDFSQPIIVIATLSSNPPILPRVKYDCVYPHGSPQCIQYIGSRENFHCCVTIIGGNFIDDVNRFRRNKEISHAVLTPSGRDTSGGSQPQATVGAIRRWHRLRRRCAAKRIRQRNGDGARRKHRFLGGHARA